MSRKLLRKLSACWTFINCWGSISPSTFPVPEIESNTMGVAHLVLLLQSLNADDAVCTISDVIRHELGAEMCRQDTNTSGHTL